MFRELDKYLKSFVGHEQQRYEALQKMTAEERERAFLTDERFIWHDVEQIGDTDENVAAVLSRQDLMITRNKRFIKYLQEDSHFLKW